LINLKKACLIFIALIFGFCAVTFAQNPYIRHYTTLNGLPTNTIYQIYQDSQKFLWFASDAGIIKFDGINYTSYRKKDGLSSNDVVRIKEDFKGRIWIFNYNGFVNYIYNGKIFNGNNEPFLNSLIGKGFILDFFIDSNQTINFYNYQREIFSLDTNNKISHTLLLKNIAIKLGLINKDYDRVRVIYLSKSSEDEWVIWANAGAYSQNILNGKVSTVDSGFNCYAVFPSRDNSLYANTYYNGVVKVTGNLQKNKIPFPFDIQIKTIIEDSEGYLWISALDGGVYCLKNSKVVKHFNIKDALGLMQDHEQNIWISTQSDGIYVINHDILEQNHFDRTNFDSYGVNKLCDALGIGIWCTNSKTAFLLKNGLINKLPAPKELQPINIIYQFKDQTLLLGSISYLIGIFEDIKLNAASKQLGYDKSIIFPITTKKVVTDRQGKTAAFFDQNRVLFTSTSNPSFNIKFNQISERINNAYYNAENKFVINAKKNYLFTNNKLEPYPELSRFDGTLISDHLFLDDSTELFNIDGDSLFILNNHRFYNLTDAFDIPFNSQITRLLYKDSTLYLATLRDIFICHNPMNLISGKPIHLEPLNISFNTINDILIQKDTLYIASDDGLTAIAEKSVTNTIQPPPIPYLKSIILNDQLYSLPNQGLNLEGKNNIKLSFSCISYSVSPVIYSYQLEGAETKWTTGSGNEFNLIYQNLPKGNYTLKLKARKLNSGWSKPLELSITIKPTLVEYPAFWGFIAFIASGLIFLIISLIRIEKRKRVEVDHQLIVMEQKALQSMMNPHFIFNSLGSIQNYLLKNKGSDAVIYLSQFARLIRQNLNAINTPMIYLEEEVDRLRNYIELEKKRLENKFEYSIEVDKILEEDGVYIPSMIIQPIVENSIWHGIATMEEAGTVKISLQAYQSKSLRIIVEDNGIGMNASKEYAVKSSQNHHLGMQIIQKRLALLSKKYKTETRINYSEYSPGHKYPGTIVEIIMPFIYTIDDI